MQETNVHNKRTECKVLVFPPPTQLDEKKKLPSSAGAQGGERFEGKG
jgi:hypothetical protein